MEGGGRGKDDAPFGVETNESELLPAAVHDVLHAEVHLAGHDGRVGFAGELVEIVEGDGIDFVVDVKASFSSVRETVGFGWFGGGGGGRTI